MKATIYHNPGCSNSRGALAILNAQGRALRIVEYLKTPLSASEIGALAAQLPGGVRDLIRAKEPVYAELGLDKASDAALLEAMAAHPILMNRPVVVTEKGTRLCRPPETVREIL